MDFLKTFHYFQGVSVVVSLTNFRALIFKFLEVEPFLGGVDLCKINRGSTDESHSIIFRVELKFLNESFLKLNCHIGLTY